MKSKIHFVTLLFLSFLSQPDHLPAQSPRLVLEVNGGLQPRGRIRQFQAINPDRTRRPLFSATGIGRVGLGFRLSQYFQIDSGLDLGGSLAELKRTINVVEVSRNDLPFTYTPQPETRQVTDTMIMVPLGGRIVIPLFSERIRLGLGAGGTYLRHWEHAQGENVDCTSCRARSGLGGCGLGRVEIVFGKNRTFGVGAFGKFTRVRAKGSLFPTLSARGVRDEWVQLGNTVSFLF